MTESHTAPTPVGALGPTIHLERTASRQYIARNSRGAEVRVGKGPGEFSPGDLLKIAIAGCTAMTTDTRLGAAVGEDFTQVITVSGDYVEAEDRYASFDVELIQDLSSLPAEELDRLLARANAAADRNCTIGHSFAHPMPVTRTFSSEVLEDAGSEGA